MSKILFIGDPHLKISRFDLCIRFLKWMNDTIAETKPDLVVNLGDTFDTHAVLRSEIKTEFRKHVDFVNDLGIPYYYVLGNHDFYKPDSSEYHALKDWKESDLFRIIDSRIDIDNITYIPYVPNIEDFPLDTKEICVAHQTFIGADYGYTRPDSGVDAAKVEANIIISGHVHLRQEFGKVIYPGTPYAHGANDIDQVKGVMLFDTASYSKEFIESPFPMWRGLKYEISEELCIDTIHDDVISTVNSNDNWIIELTGPKADILSYIDSNGYKELCTKNSISLRTKFTDKLKKQKNIEAISMEHVINEYVQAVYSGNINKEEIVLRSLSILNKVKQLGYSNK